MYRLHRPAPLDRQQLLRSYARGIFPMGEPDGSIRWYSAEPRGILPLDRFHVPGTLRQTVRQARFDVRINSDFEQTMRRCGSVDRNGGTWINEPLVAAYVDLHRAGFAHSVEAWQDGLLVGGLYGVSLGGAFFGESMFHLVRDASKVALVTLVSRLRERGYVLLDTQTSSGHLKRFGGVGIPTSEYLKRLESALKIQCHFG